MVLGQKKMLLIDRYLWTKASEMACETEYTSTLCIKSA